MQTDRRDRQGLELLCRGSKSAGWGRRRDDSGIAAPKRPLDQPPDDEHDRHDAGGNCENIPLALERPRARPRTRSIRSVVGLFHVVSNAVCLWRESDAGIDGAVVPDDRVTGPEPRSSAAVSGSVEFRLGDHA
jgi:hypothetical protein